LIEIQEIDVVREPSLLPVVQLLDGHGRITFDDPWERTYMLACGAIQPCPKLGPDNLCTIYPSRPNACVAMEAGDEQCQMAREMRGLPPLEPTAKPPGMKPCLIILPT
jgi:Fe-S-cluster containining protein